jgi:hypothetical protein
LTAKTERRRTRRKKRPEDMRPACQALRRKQTEEFIFDLLKRLSLSARLAPLIQSSVGHDRAGPAYGCPICCGVRRLCYGIMLMKFIAVSEMSSLRHATTQ